MNDIHKFVDRQIKLIAMYVKIILNIYLDGAAINILLLKAFSVIRMILCINNSIKDKTSFLNVLYSLFCIASMLIVLLFQYYFLKKHEHI